MSNGPNGPEFHEGCENMSNEEFIEHLCAWDYTNGEGEYEDGQAILDFFLTVSLTLEQTPPSSPLFKRLESKKQEVENIYRMKNEIVKQITDIVDETNGTDQK
jgi:hypothetical protein